MDVNTYIMTPIHRIMRFMFYLYLYHFISHTHSGIAQHIKNEIKNALDNAGYAPTATIPRWTREILCSIECISDRAVTTAAAAGIIIALRYYRTWFYYHIMAIRGWLPIVFVSWLVGQLLALFTVHNLQCTLLIFILCAPFLSLSRAVIQVCSSVEIVSICTNDSSDSNWKLFHPMHIFRVCCV